MAKAKRFIAGIYNYCDRWCERCPYTARCRVYRDTERAARRHRERGEEANDPDLLAEDVSRSFEKAQRLLERHAKPTGSDLEEMAPDGAAELAERQARQDLDAHPMIRGARHYMKLCGKLLAELGRIFNQARDDAESRAAFMDVASEADQLARVREALDILAWDHALICAKVRRALRGKRKADVEEDPDLHDAAMSDAAGSAFVARRSLIRSQAALTEIHDWDAEHRDQVIDLLVTTERIQRALEGLIPEAVTFSWPPSEEE